MRKSYGIICIRKHENQYQILMVKKPVTYYFCDFVLDRCKWADGKYIPRMFDNMTYHEKMDILSFKFSTLWYRIYHIDPESDNMTRDQMTKYMNKKDKFSRTHLRNKDKIRNAIMRSNNADTIWEIPKGRKRETEAPVDAAIREFKEETTVHFDDYTMLPRMKPYVETYTDCGITYQSTYYYADIKSEDKDEDTKSDINIKFRNLYHISEVEAVRWCSMADLKHMHRGAIAIRLCNMFKKIIKKYKNRFRLSLVAPFEPHKSPLNLNPNPFRTT